MAALGIILIAAGAILSFAVQDSIAEVDLTMVGYILMGVGVVAVITGGTAGQRERCDGPERDNDLRNARHSENVVNRTTACTRQKATCELVWMSVPRRS